MRYYGTISLEPDFLKWCELAFSVDDLSDEERIEFYRDNNLYRDDHIPISVTKFSNGNSITFDIWSGSSNYYDDWILWFPDGDYYQFDPAFEVGEGTVDLEYEGDIYTLTITKEE